MAQTGDAHALAQRFARFVSGQTERFRPQGDVGLVWMLAETLAFTLAALLIGYWIDPHNPLQQGAEFPWALIAPLLLALRYGVSAGLASMLLMLAAWWLGHQAGAEGFGQFPRLYFLGGLIMTLIAGEFSGNWQLRIRRIGETNAYLYERLRRVSSHYYLTKLSHDRLEHEFLLKPTTMRDALASLKHALDAAAHQPGNSLLTRSDADQFLRLLSQYCGIEEAGLYRMGETVSLAYLGGPVEGPSTQAEQLPPLALDDPMVRHALEHKLLTHLQSDAVGKQPDTQYQVVAPILTSDDEVLGLVAIRRIGFFALHQETLLMLAAMMGYLADTLRVPSVSRRLLDQHPDCPAEFAEEVGKLAHLSETAQVQSWLVLQIFSQTEAGQDTIEAIRRMRRGLDSVWLFPGRERHAVLTLLPMTNDAGVDGYLQRIGKWLDDLYGAGFSLTHRRSHAEQVSRRPLQQLARITQMADENP
jgi:hypothetical protein